MALSVTVTAEAATLTYVPSTHRNWLTPKSEAINFATPSPVDAAARANYATAVNSWTTASAKEQLANQATVLRSIIVANSRVETRSLGQRNANFQEPKRPGHVVDAASCPAPKHNLYHASPNTHRSKCIQGQERILQLHSELEVVHTELRNAHRRKPC